MVQKPKFNRIQSFKELEILEEEENLTKTPSYEKKSKSELTPWKIWWIQKEENEISLKNKITQGKFEAVKELLTKEYAKPSVNRIYEDMETPLHYAWLIGDLDIINILVDNLAGLNTINKLKRTPLHYVSQLEADIFESDMNDEESENLKLVK